MCARRLAINPVQGAFSRRASDSKELTPYNCTDPIPHTLLPTSRRICPRPQPDHPLARTATATDSDRRCPLPPDSEPPPGQGWRSARTRRRGPAPRASPRRRNQRVRASASVSEAADRTDPAGPSRPDPARQARPDRARPIGPARPARPRKKWAGLNSGNRTGNVGTINLLRAMYTKHYTNGAFKF